jgi:hypothetical protein
VSERNNISELFNIRLFSICSYPTRHANGWLDSAARQHRRHPDFSAYTFEATGCSDSEVFRLTFYGLSFLCFGRFAPAISNWTCARAGLKGI